MIKFIEFFNEKTGLSRDTLSRYKTKASDARLQKNLSVKKRDNRFSGVAKAAKHLDAMEDVDEAKLSPAARLAKGRVLKRNKAKIMMGRKKAARKMADQGTLERRAKKQALGDIKKKILKGKSYNDLSSAAKNALADRLSKPAMKTRIARISKKLVKDKRKEDRARKQGK